MVCVSLKQARFWRMLGGGRVTPRVFELILNLFEAMGGHIRGRSPKEETFINHVILQMNRNLDFLMICVASSGRHKSNKKFKVPIHPLGWACGCNNS